MYYTTFMKWMWNKLSDIRMDDMMEETGRLDYIRFLGWGGPGFIYARFLINRKDLPNGQGLDKLLVAHEGDWTKEEGMSCHSYYNKYEDVQFLLGKGLSLRKKGYSKINNRSLFLYDFDNRENDGEYILAVPATGEEIYFEIYGVDPSGDLVLLVKREL